MKVSSFKMTSDPNFGFSKGQIDEILADQYGKIDFLMERFLIIHCFIALGLAFIYSTWMITIPVATSAFLMFALCRRAAPGSLLTRCVAGISLQAFVALHIYQLHGLPEMHFFFFTAQTMMILYFDSRAFWPGTVLIIIQHILFSALTNAGYHVNFFPETYVSTSKQFFHYSIAVWQVGICAYWAHYLRSSLLRDTRQRVDLLDTNAALDEARSAAERANGIKSQFLANMSHELRTPLNGVIGMSALLQEMDTDESSRDYIDCIKSSGETLLSLVNDILDLSKIEAGKITVQHKEFGIEETVDDVLATMQSKAMEKGLEFLAVVDENVPRIVKGDPDRIKQIWINLIGNALKFTNIGSVILRIGWEQTGPGHGLLTGKVTDTGIGIPEKFLETIFDSFSQVAGKASRDNGGAGLGLAISRQLVSAMKGELSVESKLMNGSTFTCRLPLEGSTSSTRITVDPRRCLILGETDHTNESLSSMLKACGITASVVQGSELQEAHQVSWNMIFANDAWLNQHGQEALLFFAFKQLVVTTAELSEHEAGVTYLRKPLRYSQLRTLLQIREREIVSESATRKSLVGCHFLVVEDNYVNQRILSEMLLRQGAEVDLAVNGQIGLEMMQMGRYDAIFMDCQMPVMDGYESTRRIREIEHGGPTHRRIVATTANAMSGDQDECLRSGMDDYIVKPITRSALLAVVERVLAERATEPAAA